MSALLSGSCRSARLQQNGSTRKKSFYHHHGLIPVWAGFARNGVFCPCTVTTRENTKKALGMYIFDGCMMDGWTDGIF